MILNLMFFVSRYNLGNKAWFLLDVLFWCLKIHLLKSVRKHLPRVFFSVVDISCFFLGFFFACKSGRPMKPETLHSAQKQILKGLRALLCWHCIALYTEYVFLNSSEVISSWTCTQNLKTHFFPIKTSLFNFHLPSWFPVVSNSGVPLCLLSSPSCVLPVLPAFCCTFSVLMPSLVDFYFAMKWKNLQPAACSHMNMHTSCWANV